VVGEEEKRLEQEQGN